MKSYDYLKITIMDNDFTGYGYILGSTIRDLLSMSGLNVVLVDPDNISYELLDQLRDIIGSLWLDMDNLENLKYSHKVRTKEEAGDSFVPVISLVTKDEIPTNENSEVIYIPLVDYPGYDVFIN